MGEARKDAIEQQYQQREDNLNAQLGNLEVNRAQNIANAVKGVSRAASDIASYMDSTEKPIKPKQEEQEENPYV